MNVGKKFEDQFRKSIPDYCLLIRLPDPPQSFTQREDTKFSKKNPCDFIMFDTKNKDLYCIELKTTKSKSISFEKLDDLSSSNRMIHKHQILGLQKFSEFEYVTGCFILNFRDEKNNMERTYFQDIKDFLKMYKDIDKHSFNELDLLTHNAIKINGERKRINYKWNIDELLSRLKGGK